MNKDSQNIKLKEVEYNILKQKNTENTIVNNRMLLHEKINMYIGKFKELFTKITNWSDDTQSIIIELLKIAGAFEENFMKEIDKRVKNMLKGTNLMEEEYTYEYFLNYIQCVLQSIFFNRKVNGKKIERWQTKPQKFYTQKNKNKIKNMLSSMPEFIDEVKIDKNKNYDYYIVLGAVIHIMKIRLDFVLDNIKKNKQKKIIILTSNRQVFLKDEIDENNKNIMDLIENAKSLEEILNTSIVKLTREQSEVIKYYINNNFSIDKFRKDWRDNILTEEGMAQIVIKETIKNIDSNVLKNLSIITLETRKNGESRANTVDTIKTLIDYLKNNDLSKIIFITTQPSCPSQYAQIKTNFGEINIAAKKVKLNDDVAKILMQNIAESFNNYYIKLTKVKNKQ